VGCFTGGASLYGCEEMSGNIREWCSTTWRKNYKQKADDQLEGNSPRVLRGGSFNVNQRSVRCASRNGYNPGGRNVNWGFRVVLSPLDISLNL